MALHQWSYNIAISNTEIINKMIFQMLFAVVYLLSCFGIAILAENKRIGSQRIFHIAVLFTPLIALMFVLLSTKKAEIQHLSVQHMPIKCERAHVPYSLYRGQYDKRHLALVHSTKCNTPIDIS